MSKIIFRIEQLTLCEEGKRETVKEIGYCESLENAFSWLRKNGTTELAYKGFWSLGGGDSRRARYNIKECKPVEYLK